MSGEVRKAMPRLLKDYNNTETSQLSQLAEETGAKQTITLEAASAVSQTHPNAEFRTVKSIDLEDVYILSLV